MEILMEAIKKYLNDKTNKDEENRKTVVAIIWAVSLIFYLYFIRGIISERQWDIFCNSNTLLFVTSSFWMGLMEMFSGGGIIASAILFVYYISNEGKRKKSRNRKTNRYSEGLKSSIFAFVVSLVIISISFMSYCRIDRDGLYVRDIRTLFVEKKYSWKSVKSVDINYYKSKSSYNIQYMIYFDGFSIDADDAGLTMKDMDMVDEGIKEIHRIVKAKGIKINKDIQKYNDEIDGFLKMIDEK